MKNPFNVENLIEFERDLIIHKKYGDVSYGSKVVEILELPEDVVELLVNEEDFQQCQLILWSRVHMKPETRELTELELERQNFVDNTIFEMLCAVLHHVNPENPPEWDIEPIAEIRDVIRQYYIDGKYDEMDFYPYLEE